VIAGEPTVRAAGANSLPRYRVVDIGDLSGGVGPPTAWVSVASGINNLGQVVGAASVTAYEFDLGHAVLWLPEPAFGAAFAVEELTDLTALAGLSLNGWARDINVHGKVIGTQTFSSPGEPGLQAVIWELDLHPGGWSYALGTLCDSSEFSCEGAVSEGLAINDSFPGVVVGLATDAFPCLGGVAPRGLAFRRGVGMSASIEVLLPNPGDNVSVAFGIGKPELPEQDPEIVGLSYPCATQTIPCNGTWDAVHWRPVLGGEGEPDVPLQELPSDDGSAVRGQANDINDDPVEEPGEPERTGEIVGFCVASTELPSGLLECVTRATYWAQAGATPLDLHDTAGFAAVEESQATAIANPDASGVTRLVGANLSQNRAWKWERLGTSWTAAQLDTLIWPGCGWERLIEARDVNDFGWIVGVGDRDQTLTTLVRGYVLIPEPCFVDFDRDGQVNGADLGILLAAFETLCPAGSECTYCHRATQCPLDLTCDGQIDGADLGVLLTWWEQCGGPGATGEAAAAMAGAGGGSLGAALAGAGFESVEAFVAWSESEPSASVLGAALLIHAILEGGEL